jgi:choline dehydrogenase
MRLRDVWDVVVVGGGAAGSVVARRLSEETAGSILLLEAGPALDDDNVRSLGDGWRLPTVPDWGYESEPDATGITNRLRRGRLLGGTSWLTRFAVRGSAADFDAWGEAGNEGWSFVDVLPWFRRLETDLDFGDRPWHGDSGPIPITRYRDLARSAIHVSALEAWSAAGFPVVDDHNAPDAIGAGPMPMSSRLGARITTLGAYLAVEARPESLTVRTECLVSSVVLAAGKAAGVELADGTRIRAQKVILSAGTYGSPPILMRSGIGPGADLREHGIKPIVELPGVGANLADHPAVDLDSGWRGPGSPGPILHSIATFRSSVPGPDRAPDLMFWLTDPDAADPAFYLDPILLKPASRGTVSLRSANPEDAPRIKLPGLTEEVDVTRLVEGYERAVDLANRPEIRRLASESAPSLPTDRSELRRRVIDNAYSLPHVVGTCRMGPSADVGAVVDHRGRVHGVDGLYVIDASIIPDPPAGFPHVITVMAAERIASHLAASA